MMNLHSVVLLYKSFDGEGFNLLSEEFKFLEQNLTYVHLSNVEFVIDQDRKQIMDDTGIRTVHALAKGTLESARPKGVRLPKDQLKYVETLPLIEYNPFTKGFFYLKKTGTEIKVANDLHAYDRKVRVNVQ